MAGFSDLQIMSKEIDRSKFTDSNLIKMKETFPHLDNDTLGRYLIARNNNLEKSTEMLQKSELWKFTHSLILKEDIKVPFNKGIVYVRGTDKEGHPLIVIRNRLNFPDMPDISMEDKAKTVLWWVEYAIAQLPDDKSKFTILVDRTGVTKENQDPDFTKTFPNLMQGLHPERLHKAIVFPSGVLFWGFWNMIKWFLDPVTRAKVAPMMYLVGVQEFVDDEYIPADMGGKSQYCFNPDGYADPYDEYEVERLRAQRAKQVESTGRVTRPFFSFDEEHMDTTGYDARKDPHVTGDVSESEGESS